MPNGIIIIDKPADWTALVQRNMQLDFSWKQPAAEYMNLYRSLLAE